MKRWPGAGIAMAAMVEATGAALAAGGAAWTAWAAWQLRAAGTPVAPRREPRVLVEEGPYRISRNPMALGTAALLTGLPLAAGAPWLALATPLYLLHLQRVRIPAEEARLARHFGGWYRDYAASVRRWL